MREVGGIHAPLHSPQVPPAEATSQRQRFASSRSMFGERPRKAATISLLLEAWRENGSDAVLASVIESACSSGAHHGVDIESIIALKRVSLIPWIGPSETFAFDAEAASRASRRVVDFRGVSGNEATREFGGQEPQARQAHRGSAPLLPSPPSCPVPHVVVSSSPASAPSPPSGWAWHRSGRP